MSKEQKHLVVLDHRGHPKQTVCGHSTEWITRHPKAIFWKGKATCRLCLAYQSVLDRRQRV